MDAIEYGIKCEKKDEKDIVKNINKFLATKNYRKMYKWKDKGGIRNIDDPGSDPQLEYTYTQFLKQSPRWLFEISLNVDLRNIHRFPDHPDCAWTLFFNKVCPELNSETEDLSLDNFLKELLKGTGFECTLMFKYKKNDYRK
jgi:hypothetical protein